MIYKYQHTMINKTTLSLSLPAINGRDVISPVDDQYIRKRKSKTLVESSDQLPLCPPLTNGTCVEHDGKDLKHPEAGGWSQVNQGDQCSCSLPNPKFCMLNIVEAFRNRMHRKPTKQWVKLSVCAT